jgi:photosystem II stability/assembly factor-like uncharacterized protein
MGDEKKKIVFAVIGVIVTIGIIVALYFLFSGNKKTDQSRVATTTVAEVVVPPVETTAKDSILKSTDGGETFESYFAVVTTGIDKKKMGPMDVLAISFHPFTEDKIIVTTLEDGLFINEDKINVWSPVAFPPKRIYGFILDKNSPDNRVFASGVMDGNGRIFRTDDAGGKWRAVYAEPGNGTYISGMTQHKKNSNIIIAGTNKGTVVRSLDGGNSWKNIGSKITGVITNFAFDSGTPVFTYFLSSGHPYFSRDDGMTWQNWSTEKKKELDALKLRAKELAKKGDKDGAAQISEQVAMLNKRASEENEPPKILLITTDPSKSGTIYAGAGGGLYRSTDFGKYWKKINIIESAEKFPIRSVAINPKNSSEIVFVAGKSFYKSINWGETWSVVPLTMSRNASFVAYDPFDPKTLFIGASTK